MAAAILASRTLVQTPNVAVVPFEDGEAEPSPTGRKPKVEVSPIATWSAQRVASWLRHEGFAQMAESAQRQDVDGACLLELSAAAWAELGCTSAVQCCKLVSMVKKAAAHHARPSSRQVGAADAPPPAARQDFSIGHKHEERVAKHFTSGMNARSPDGGAEHNITWVLAIANANTNPVEVKQHCLRFLGMYNVIDLLVLTIDVTYLMSAELEGVGPTSWAGYVVFFLYALGAWLSGMGMVSSTIMYNTASAVSDANFIAYAKLPSTLRQFKMVNDASIWSGNFTTFATFFLIYRVSIDLTEGATWRMYPGGPDVAAHWYFCTPLLLVPFYGFWRFFSPFMHGVISGTHLVMYSGLMSSEPLPALAEDPTWAHRSSPGQIAEYLSEVSIRNGQPKRAKDCQVGIATLYAEQSVATISGDEANDGALSAAAGEPTQLLTSLTSILTSVLGGSTAASGGSKMRAGISAKVGLAQS